jgi:hypothetical protein
MLIHLIGTSWREALVGEVKPKGLPCVRPSHIQFTNVLYSNQDLLRPSDRVPALTW